MYHQQLPQNPLQSHSDGLEVRSLAAVVEEARSNYRQPLFLRALRERSSQGGPLDQLNF